MLQRLVQHNNYSQHSGSPDRAAITVAKFLGGATGGLEVQAFAPDAKMYGAVVIARMVREELLRSPASDIVRAWITKAPSWLEVRTPVNAPNAFMAKLDAGEQDAIVLAAELDADQLIVDDREGGPLRKSRTLSAFARGQGFRDRDAPVEERPYQMPAYQA